MTARNKSEILKLYTAKRMGMDDYVARSLSAMIRACPRDADRRYLLSQADVLEVTEHPAFII